MVPDGSLLPPAAGLPNCRVTPKASQPRTPPEPARPAGDAPAKKKPGVQLPESYALVRKVGHGAYGAVAAYRDAATDRVVAVKRASGLFTDLVDAKRILREIKLLRHFRHDNVVTLIDFLVPEDRDFDEVCIVMEMIDTDLHRVIYSKQELTDPHVQYFVYQILRGLKYVHSANVVHRDLKPQNILVNKDCELKICDFGLARGFGEGEEDCDFTHYVVTRWYRAPEVMLTAKQYTRSVDMWSVGCILGEMVTRRALFKGRNAKEQIALAVQLLVPPRGELAFVERNTSAYRFVCAGVDASPPRKPWPEVFPTATWNEPLMELLDALLHFDPDLRPDPAAALEYEYVLELHDPSDEATCENPVDWRWDLELPLTRDALMEAMYAEHLSMHAKT